MLSRWEPYIEPLEKPRKMLCKGMRYRTMRWSRIPAIQRRVYTEYSPSSPTVQKSGLSLARCKSQDSPKFFPSLPKDEMRTKALSM